MAKRDVMTEDDGDDIKEGAQPGMSQEDAELIIVENKQDLAAEDDGQEDEDDRVQQTSDDDHEDEREAIRERRRAEKQERKERRDQAIKRDKLELEFLRKRNDDLERRITTQEQRSQANELSQLDVQINNAMNEVTMAEQVIAKAVAAGNGEDVTQAMRYRDQALAKANQLSAYKQQAQQRQQTPTPQPVDDVTMAYAKEFMDEHKWYDPQGRDEDSSIVIAIDQAMAKDGYFPNTEEYWDELRARVARRLPEKFQTQRKTQRESREPRGGPVVGSGREHAPASTRKEVYISPERKQALIDAGVWDDPVLRMKYVKRYAEYDRQNRA